MLTLGILLIIGLIVAGIHFLIIVRALLLVIGLALAVLGAMGRAVADGATITERRSLRCERFAPG
jgi:hypothetical protein